MQIKYVGPKDFKTINGQRFPRLVPVTVPDAVAAGLLENPEVFLPAEQDVPAETLAQRSQLPEALRREAQERIEQYEIMRAHAMAMPQGAIDEKTGRPDWVMQKRLDAIKGAQDEIDAGKELIAKADRLEAKINAENAVAASSGKRGRQAAEV